jgi:hypothetical protein
LTKTSMPAGPGQVQQLPLFDWDRLTPPDAGLAKLPPGMGRDGDVHDLATFCRIMAGFAQRYFQHWVEAEQFQPQDPSARARLRRLYEQETRFQVFLAEQTERIRRGEAAGVDLSGFSAGELVAFRQFLEAEVARLDLDLQRASHPDYPIRDLGARGCLLHNFSLKRSLCSYLYHSIPDQTSSE